MTARLAIAATLSAVMATIGAVICSVVAALADASGFGAALLTAGGGIMLGVCGVALVLAIPAWRVGPTPAPESGVNRGLAHVAAEIDRLAQARHEDELRLRQGPWPSALRLALERLADRLAEHQRRALMRETENRENQSRHEELIRRLRAELDRRSEALDASQRVQDAFLTRMSHELRTPLTAILGYLEMMEEEAEDPEMRGDLLKVRASALSLLATLTTILDLTQLEAGSFDVIPEHVDVVTLARNVQASVRAQALANENQVDVYIVDGLLVKLDRRMLQSILYNLTSNACKYTTRGKVRLDIREVQGRLRVVVADTGIGMTERQIEEAFRPFAQADGSTTRRYDGTGLGLAVVRGFAEAMGGRIQIRSQLGKGAEVEVDLPFQCAARSGYVAEEDTTMLVR